MSDSKISLKPITPHLSNRYKKSNRVDVEHQKIPAALFTENFDPEPGYLPEGWQSYVHPEGSPYFHKNDPQLKVVTAEDLSSQVVLGSIQYCVEEIVRMFEEKNFSLSDSYELCLEFCESGLSCGYYIADHSTRCIFWLDPVSTEDLEMNPAFSLEHLRYASEGMYWSHVEFYPSHKGASTDGLVLNLMRTLAHAQGDALTSSVSTFPYSAEESARFMKLIKPFINLPVDGHILCFVARLNSYIVANKFYQHHGQPHGRLSRDQSIIDANPVRTYWPSSTLSRILFGVPASFVDRFESLYIDAMVYTNDFRNFLASCQEERLLFINLSFCAMLMHAGSLATGLGLSFLSPFGLLCAIASIISGVYFHSSHREFLTSSANEGYSYLTERRHDEYGFQYLALLFSLPKALSLWSIALLVPHVLFIVYSSIGTTGFCALALFLAWSTFVFRYKLVPSSFHWLPSRKTSEGTIELDGHV